eukprot:TRINITY_DN1131_c0_g3_i1.p1 TRINITY_DN1131_c0_g3~~TRINITY_DN1131_c0_g3_i1.p1  ORF type:complete len:2488 (+),score=898.26 TRINITY_DN1131_c0_g3_i1:439-7902(+)
MPGLIRQREARLASALDVLAVVALCALVSPADGQSDKIELRYTGNTNENGQETTVQITLLSKPTGNLTLPLKVSNPLEAEVLQSQVAITTDKWNVSVSFKVKGLNDYVADGDIDYKVIVGPVFSTDRFDVFRDAVAELSLKNVDDDEVAIYFKPASITTTENSSEPVDINMTLGSRPSGDVTFVVSSENEGEGVILKPNTVTFTHENWNISQTVKLQSIEDEYDDDGDQTFKVVTTPVVSTDMQYNGIHADLTVKNIDVHTSGVSIKPGTCVLAIWEHGRDEDPVSAETRFIEIVLTSRPRATVTVPLSSEMPNEAKFDKDQVVFSRDNWNVTQKVEVLPTQDTNQDCDVAVKIKVENAVSADPKYDAQHSEPLTVLSLDDDGLCLHAYPACIQTTEANVSPAKMMAWITNPQVPTGDLSVQLISSKLHEAHVRTAPPTDPPKLTFTPANYKVPQVFWVDGVDDDYDDGDQQYNLNLGPIDTTDTSYKGKESITVFGENFNDETAGVVMVPDPIIVNEDPEVGNEKTVRLHLTSKPYSMLVLNLMLINTSTGLEAQPPSKFSYGPTTFTIQPDDWTKPLEFVAKTGDNWIDDGDFNYKVTITGVTSHKNDTEKYNKEMQSGVLNIVNNDTARVSINMEGSNKFEEGKANVTTWTVVLTSEPLDDTLVYYEVLEQYQRPGVFEREVSMTPDVLTFTKDTWNVPQTFTAVGNDDDFAEGLAGMLNLYLKFRSNSTDPKYNLTQITDLWLQSIDDDIPMLNTSAKDVADENGQPATVLIKLATEPMCNWSHITQASATDSMIMSARIIEAPGSERARLEPAQYHFPRSQWQSVMPGFEVYSIDNRISDGDVNVTVEVTIDDACYHYGALLDDQYTHMKSNVTVTVVDNDFPGLNVSTQTRPPRTKETGAPTDILVNLNTQPKADVKVAFSLDDATEGRLGKTELIFTKDNWNLPQAVLVTGVDDDIMDGDVTYQVTLTPTSADADYNAITPIVLDVINEDDDIPGLQWSMKGGEKNATIITSEDEEQITVDIRLNTKPTADVVLSSFSATPATEGLVVDPTTSLTFTPGNWDKPQPLVVRGVDDPVMEKDGDQPFLVYYNVTTTDPNYTAWNPTPLPGRNDDNDIPGLVVSPVQGHTTEDGDVFVFSVRLRTLPKANVNVRLQSDNLLEGTTNVSTLHYTPASWKMLQYVAVTGVDDTLFDRDVAYNIVFTTPMDTVDNDYVALTSIPPVQMINKDNEVSPCAVFAGTCSDLNCTSCCASGCATCGGPGCSSTSTDDACCDDLIKKKDKTCTLTSPAPCVVREPPNSLPCSRYGGICRDVTCSVCCSAGCGICGGPTCTDSGHSDKCCEDDIFQGNQSCAVTGKAPCVRVSLCANVVCQSSGECRGAGVCDEKTGKCTDPAVGDGATCSQGVCQNGVCAPPAPVCGGVQCTPSTACATVTCEANVCKDKAAVPAPSTCNDNNPLTTPDTCSGASCTGKSLCGSGVCSAGNCDVCCEATCGSMCGSGNCQGLCCTDPIVDTKQVCNADASNLPCIRKPTQCLTYGGVCNDAVCDVCCPASCGDKCGATDCALGEGGADACCKKNIIDNKKVCTAYTLAPCSRQTQCEQYGGICKDSTCEVCCAAECGECDSPTCGNNGMASKCCAGPITDKKVPCSASSSAPCLRPVPKDPCTLFGGICSNSSCTVCCDSECGLKCGAPDCATATAGADKCCPDKIEQKYNKKCSEVPAIVMSPCLRDNLCVEFGGVCNDAFCSVCCHGSCGVCGGEEGCLIGSQCCDKTIPGEKKPCDEGHMAPCTRVTPCTEFGGTCSDPSCTSCCDKSCPECGSSAVACSAANKDKCCTQELFKKQAYCSKTQASPCLRVTKCSDFGGICKDDACTACCDASCGVCGGSACTANPTDAKCCDTAIVTEKLVCSVNPVQSAPCTRVNSCTEFNGICADEACEVCCAKECGTCGSTPSVPYDPLKCPTTTDILKQPAPSCDESKSAPCIRNGRCSEFGGKCEDAECRVCCAASCDKCGGELCHFESEHDCCPSKINKGTAECSSTQAAPCIRHHQCNDFNGICNNEECTVCCHASCGTCGGITCALDPQGPENCCEADIIRIGGEKTCSSVNTAPCKRVNEKCPGGICPDAECAVCCNAGCGDSCGATTCALHPLGPGNCCPDIIIDTHPNKTCSADVPGPCRRVTKCAEMGGLCEDDTCNVCCDKACEKCGGPDCANDPAGASKCCPALIVQSGKSCAPVPEVPCVRVTFCEEHNGICSNEECTVCCPKECGECDKPACESRPGGASRCCGASIIAAGSICGINTAAPCVRPAQRETSPSGGDDDAFPWWLLLLVLLLLCSCLALLAFILFRMRKQKQDSESNRHQTMFGMEDKKEEMGQTLLSPDDEEQPPSSNGNGNGQAGNGKAARSPAATTTSFDGLEATRENSNGSVPRAKSSSVASNLSPPSRSAKKRSSQRLNPLNSSTNESAAPATEAPENEKPKDLDDMI